MNGATSNFISGMALQWVNDLPGVLAQIRRALKPDGLFLAALLGGDTLTELRQSFAAAESEVEGGLSPRVLPFADLRDLGALLQRAEAEMLNVIPSKDNLSGMSHSENGKVEFVPAGAKNILST